MSWPPILASAGRRKKQRTPKLALAWASQKNVSVKSNAAHSPNCASNCRVGTAHLREYFHLLFGFPCNAIKDANRQPRCLARRTRAAHPTWPDADRQVAGAALRQRAKVQSKEPRLASAHLRPRGKRIRALLRRDSRDAVDRRRLRHP